MKIISITAVHEKDSVKIYGLGEDNKMYFYNAHMAQWMQLLGEGIWKGTEGQIVD
jgi:hypothetical protein